jgi:Leucine-rich repeat (LRR) protein
MALAAAVENLPALTGLRLWDNQLGAEAAGALAGSKLLTNLTTLDLSANKITPAGAVAVAGSKFLTKLTSLVVDEQAVGKKGKRALLDRFGEAVVTFR